MERSIVIPAYDAAGFVAERLALLSRHLEAHSSSYELIVVDDGSGDGTGDVVRELELPHARVLSLPRNRGKFGALAAGIAASRGRCVLFTDADVPYELGALEHMSELVLARGYHLVLGDRTLAESGSEESDDRLRRLASGLVRAYVRVLVTGGIYDTQCGIKALDGDVARALFPLLREERFSGAVELIYVALRYNFAIRRVPVRLVHHGPSSVRFLDGLAMFPASLRIRARRIRGAYESPELARLVAQTY